jgi:hypothetical protein
MLSNIVVSSHTLSPINHSSLPLTTSSPHLLPLSLLPSTINPPNPTLHPPLKPLTPNRHLQLVKRVLHYIIRVQLIYLPNHTLRVRLPWFGEQQEFRACKRLETLPAEERRFEDVDARGGKRALVGGGRGSGDWGETGRDGVDAGEGLARGVEEGLALGRRRY